MLFVSIYLHGCIAVYDVPYNEPEFSDKHTLDDLIGALNEAVLNRFGSPEQVFSSEESICYLYSGPAKTLIFVVPGFYPEDIQFCVLLEFNKEGVLKKHYIRRVAIGSLCDGITPLQGINPASEEVLLSEAKIGNAAAYWELYKRSKSRGEHDLKLLCTAAEQGDYRARWELGYLHSYGLYGVRKDLVLSAMWYSLVESAGHDPKGVDNIRKQLTPEQLTEAERLYDNWEPGQCEREIFGTEPNN